jgi:hypothetical protein
MHPIARTGGTRIDSRMGLSCPSNPFGDNQSIYQSRLALSQRLALFPILDSTAIGESASLHRYCRYKELHSLITSSSRK